MTRGLNARGAVALSILCAVLLACQSPSPGAATPIAVQHDSAAPPPLPPVTPVTPKTPVTPDSAGPHDAGPPAPDGGDAAGEVPENVELSYVVPDGPSCDLVEATVTVHGKDGTYAVWASGYTTTGTLPPWMTWMGTRGFGFRVVHRGP
jgi:hypothetical protein